MVFKFFDDVATARRPPRRHKSALATHVRPSGIGMGLHCYMKDAAKSNSPPTNRNRSCVNKSH